MNGLPWTDRGLRIALWRAQALTVLLVMVWTAVVYAVAHAVGRASARAEAAMNAGQKGVTAALLYRAAQCANLAAPLRPGLVCD